MGKVSSLILALGIAAAGFLVQKGIIEARRDRTVEVRGLAEREVSADQGTLEIRFRVADDSLEGLNSKLKAAFSAVTDFAKESGFADSEIRRGGATTSDTRSDGYSRGSETTTPRYIANAVVYVYSNNVKQLDSTATNSDQLLSKGVVVESSATRFSFTKLNQIKPEMVKEATGNAREAAEGFARDAGSRLGKLRNATQGLFSISTPGQNYEDPSSIQKKVRVVTQVVFDLE